MNLPANKKLLLVTISLLVIPFFYIFISKVEAQTVSPLMVAPSRQELMVDPGESTALNIKFFNQGDTPISGILKVADFVVEDKEGVPTFIEEAGVVGTTKISPRFSAATWVSLPYERITIAAKNKVLVQARIRVPANARAGGRYVAIFFEPSGTPTEALGALKEATTPISVRLASLIYMRVAGPIKEDAYIVQVKAPQFSEYGPVPVISEILNRGDYHIRPIAILSLYNTFGKIVDKQTLKELNIFPDISREYQNKLGQKWMFGKYKAELVATYGEANKVVTASTYFWVLPWKAMTIAILAIVIIILLLTLFFRRFHKREEELEEKVEKLEKKLEQEKSK